jgi:peptidyl-prolyl cis-trans isomerase B (cyclophilin B)
MEGLLVPRKQRERELARAKWERQQQRRRAEQARARRRRIALGVLLGLAALLLVGWLVWRAASAGGGAG